jgi:hypothetical protein
VANPLDIELHASGAESAPGSGAAVDIGSTRSCVEIKLEVTALSGSAEPTLTVSVETSPTGAGSWKSIGQFSTTDQVGFEKLVFAGCERYVRAVWSFTGTTPSATFVVSGQAHQLYADLGDLRLPDGSLDDIAATTQAAGLLRATGQAASALASSNTLPIVQWGADIRGAVKDIALYHIISDRGFNPDGPDAVIVKRHDDALAWFKEVAAGRQQPDGLVDSTSEVFEGGSYAVSTPSRGW